LFVGIVLYLLGLTVSFHEKGARGMTGTYVYRMKLRNSVLLITNETLLRRKNIKLTHQIFSSILPSLLLLCGFYVY
jgi:hypothetical protein